MVGALNNNFGLLGYGIIGIFVISWIVSALIYRVMGYDALETRVTSPSIDQRPGSC